MIKILRRHGLWMACAAAALMIGGAAMAQIIPENGNGATPAAGPTRPPLITPIRPPLVSPIQP